MLDFTRVSPESVGISSDVIRTFLSRGKALGLHSFALLRHGRCVSEAYFAPYAQNKRHMLYSLSKSFTSLACAFAVQDGLLRYEDHVADFFPDKVIPEEKRDLRVEHLLSMSVGTETTDRFQGIDWVQDFLSAIPEHAPGTVFRYDTSATFMVAAILSRLLDRSVECYLSEKLLTPLGIDDHFWELSPEGYARGGFGFNIRLRDIARLGQFLLQRGCWEGKQLLDPALIDRSTQKQIENGTPVPGKPCDWAMGYGYQFWRCEPEGVYRGDGAYGQYCIVLPLQDAVIVTNAGTHDMQAILTEIWATLLPAMSTPMAENPDALAALRLAEAEAHIEYPSGTPLPQELFGSYTLGDRTLRLSLVGDVLHLEQMKGDKATLLLRAGFHHWIECGERAYAYACEGNAVHLREVHHLTPFGHQHTLHIEDGTLREEVTAFAGCVDPSYALFRTTPGSASILW